MNNNAFILWDFMGFLTPTLARPNYFYAKINLLKHTNICTSLAPDKVLLLQLKSANICFYFCIKTYGVGTH